MLQDDDDSDEDIDDLEDMSDDDLLGESDDEPEETPKKVLKFFLYSL